MHVLHTRPPLQRRYQVKALEYSPDGRYLLAGIERRQRDLWQPNEQGRLLRFDLFEPASEPLEKLGHGFLDVAWSPDGSAVAAVTGVRLDVLDTELVSQFRADVEHASQVEFGNDGQGVVVVHSRLADGGLAVYTTAGGSLSRLSLVEFRPRIGVVALASAPWATDVAFGGRDYVTLPDLNLRAEQPGWVQHLAFSPDGDLLAAASGWRVVLWEVRNDELLRRHELKGHGKEVTDLAFSPDGRLLLSTSLDGSVRMWDPGSGREIVQLDCGTGPVRSVACHPDGTTAAIGGSRKSAIVLLDLP